MPNLDDIVYCYRLKDGTRHYHPTQQSRAHMLMYLEGQGRLHEVVQRYTMTYRAMYAANKDHKNYDRYIHKEIAPTPLTPMPKAPTQEELFARNKNQHRTKAVEYERCRRQGRAQTIARYTEMVIPKVVKKEELA